MDYNVNGSLSVDGEGVSTLFVVSINGVEEVLIDIDYEPKLDKKYINITTYIMYNTAISWQAYSLIYAKKTYALDIIYKISRFLKKLKNNEDDKKYTPLQLILKIEEKISGYGKIKGISDDRQKH